MSSDARTSAVETHRQRCVGSHRGVTPRRGRGGAEAGVGIIKRRGDGGRACELGNVGKLFASKSRGPPPSTGVGQFFPIPTELERSRARRPPRGTPPGPNHAKRRRMYYADDRDSDGLVVFKRA